MYPNTKESAMQYISYTHFSLMSLTYFNNNIYASEETLIEDYKFNELISNKWPVNVLSLKTIELLKRFRDVWLEYRKEHSYASDYLFVLFDADWKKILKENLFPSLDAMEAEMRIMNIDFTPYLDVCNIDFKPSDDEILERVEQLYRLLLDNNIISNTYMA